MSSTIMKDSYRNFSDAMYGKDKDVKKFETIKQVVHKAISREAADNWRKHIPVYGWTQMNYPSNLQPSLYEKYKEQERLKRVELEKELQAKLIQKNENIYDGEKKHSKIGSSTKQIFVDKKNISQKNLPKSFYPADTEKRILKHKNRIYPDLVNEDVMKESKIY
jgi:hypothetical protein